MFRAVALNAELPEDIPVILVAKTVAREKRRLPLARRKSQIFERSLVGVWTAGKENTPNSRRKGNASETKRREIPPREHSRLCSVCNEQTIGQLNMQIRRNAGRFGGGGRERTEMQQCDERTAR